MGCSICKQIPKATLGRIPVYLNYLKLDPLPRFVSAPAIAKALRYGEMTVRKDLGIIGGAGRPRLGYERRKLVESMERILGLDDLEPVILVGAGKLGNALLNYPGFRRFGFSVEVAFDDDPAKQRSEGERPVLPLSSLEEYCRANRVTIGAITVPEAAAQHVCDRMVAAGITEIWNFAPCRLDIPPHVLLQQENLALSVAHLHMCAKRHASQAEESGRGADNAVLAR